MKRSPFTRILGTALVLATLSSSALAAPARFTDVPESHWASSYIDTAAKNSWVSGVGEGKFAPDDTLTGIQFAAMLCNAFYTEDLAEARTQCPADALWYAPIHLTAKTNDLYINTPMQDDNDAIMAPITRESMAAMLHNILLIRLSAMPESQAMLETMDRIPDLDTAHTKQQGSIALCYHLGLLSGVDEAGSFAPGDFLTRGQAAVVLCKLDDLLSTQKPAEPEKPVEPQKPDVDFLAEVVRLVNVERANADLSALSTADDINQAASVRAQELPTLFAHDRPDGRSCFTALDEANVSYHTAGENIAAGYPTPANVVEGWMNSPGHRANILNPSFTTIGVGYVHAATGYGHYWVQLFIG